MKTIRIKGSCEHCGELFKGDLPNDKITKEGGFIHSCGEETMNWDSESEIDSQDEYEGVSPEYKEITF